MSKPKNQNAAHDVSPACTLSQRCVCEDKASWRAAAKRHGFKTLSPWVVATLNAEAKRLVLRDGDRASAFNEKHPIGSRFMFNGREVRTTAEAFKRGGNVLVHIVKRQSGVLISELSPLNTDTPL